MRCWVSCRICQEVGAAGSWLASGGSGISGAGSGAAEKLSDLRDALSNDLVYP